MAKKQQKKLATESSLSYEAFVASVSPVDVHLAACTTEFARAQYFALKGDDSKVARRLDAECELAFRYESVIVVKTTIRVQMARREDSGKEVTIFDLNATFEAFFSVEPLTAYPEDYASQFAKTEAKIIVWPFLREFIADMTGRMGISPSVQIPLLLGRNPERQPHARRVVPPKV